MRRRAAPTEHRQAAVPPASRNLPAWAPLQFAYKYGSDGPRAWSKYTAGTSAHGKLQAREDTGANAIPLGARAEIKLRKAEARQSLGLGEGEGERVPPAPPLPLPLLRAALSATA